MIERHGAKTTLESQIKTTSIRYCERRYGVNRYARSRNI